MHEAIFSFFEGRCVRSKSPSRVRDKAVAGRTKREQYHPRRGDIDFPSWQIDNILQKANKKKVNGQTWLLAQRRPWGKSRSSFGCKCNCRSPGSLANVCLISRRYARYLSLCQKFWVFTTASVLGEKVIVFQWFLVEDSPLINGKNFIKRPYLQVIRQTFANDLGLWQLWGKSCSSFGCRCNCRNPGSLANVCLITRRYVR